ncbi:hypothetical protein EC991_003267 [Linnemannia zychae]|nr:hypothetical protein EC991_003267 [Linnemannia zychae]
MAHWPYTLQQIKERLRSQGRLPYRRNQVAPLRQAADPQKSKRDQPPQNMHQPPGTTGLDAVQIELAELSAVDGQETPTFTAGDDPSSPEQDLHISYMSEFGVMGFQMGGRNDSLSSSDKYIWWDYEDSTTEGLFSRERWRRALCSRPGLVNLFKYIITTTLGLVTILAIALTALGKIKNHHQVSDTIPDSLADNIMEAQIVVVKDFNRFQQSALAKVKYLQLEDHPQLKTSSRIPIWNQPIRQGCFHEKCDIEDLGKEYFAFMHPESFGIALPHNWPSLCNSCIEISRNQFVYTTKVRILGDLTCPADVSQVQEPAAPGPSSLAPSITTQSSPASSPTLTAHFHNKHRRKPKHSRPYPNRYLPHNSSKKVHKREDSIALVSSDPFVQDSAIAQLPYLIVDPATFNNLTMYDTQAALHEMVLLHVQFRFVLHFTSHDTTQPQPLINMGVLHREEDLLTYGYKDDGIATDSSGIQLETEEGIRRVFFPYTQESPMPLPIASIELRKLRHVKYVLGALDNLASHWSALDASKPWLCYWILHALDLLGYKIPERIAVRAISTMRHIQSPTGGFGGGPGQEAHLATTYAAINTLAIIGTKEAYDVVDREKLLEFLLSVKQKDGSFTMTVGGEVDVRGSYCAMSAATITNIVTPELTANAAEFIARCQTYEGGIGGFPGVEAHAGYSFCGLAALELLGRTDILNLDTLTRWSSARQMSMEGGFQGRTNKLVDGCYAFWTGGIFPILGKMLETAGQDADALDFVYDRHGLQEYLLVACQSKTGGLRDKPSKSVDYYHTCYCLSGLSLSQHQMSFRHELKDIAPGGLSALLWAENYDKRSVVGSPSNVLETTHPVLNIRMDKVRKAFSYFYGKAAEDVIEEVDIEIIRS